MKPIDKNELYQHLRGFLKSKGISLDDGAYTQRINQGCNLLTDVINTTGKTVERAKAGVDKTLDHVRQSIHKATAPKPAANPNPPRPEPAKTKARPRSKTRQPAARKRTKKT